MCAYAVILFTVGICLTLHCAVMSSQGVRKVPTVAPYQDDAASPGSDAFAPELHEREVLSSARSLPCYHLLLLCLRLHSSPTA